MIIRDALPRVPSRFRLSPASALVLVLAWAFPSGAEFLPEQFTRDAERCREILSGSLVDFYLPAALDFEHGGYKESLRDNRFVLTGEKFLTHQARQVWFFSTLALEGYRTDAALKAARHGFNFLQSKMRDEQLGGYFAKVTDAGEVRDSRKHAYLNAFALYGLAAFHRASQDPEALAAAQELFRVLDRHAYDGEFGGYQEFFHQDWKVITDAAEAGYVGATGHKTFNTHLHLLEAFAEVYRAWPEARVARRLQELVLINTVTVRFPEVDANVDAWLRDWTVVKTPRNLRASYGHDVECIWLVLDAGEALGWPDAVFRNWGDSLLASSIRWGYDRQHGGFFAGGPLGRPADDRRKTWWVQAEALAGLLKMFQVTGNPEYYRLFQQTLDFVETHQVAREGSWWATRAADGSATEDRQRSGPWQAAYHGGRAMMYCARWLDELAATK